METHPIRILLIDDDRMQARLIEEAVRGFRDRWHSVDWASTYAAGLEKLCSGSYALCLLDYALDDGDGLGLLREAVARGVTTPVVFLTASSDPEVDQAALEAGAVDYLVKGEVTPALLERSVRYTLRLAQTMEQLRALAAVDQLTGLFNRREFARCMREEWERNLRYGQPFAVVLLDVDHFKSINDTHGHLAGDESLHWVARLLKSNTRSVDKLFRVGGDEFACLLTETDESAAMVCAERLVATLGDAPIPLADTHTRVTLSAGVAAVSLAMVSSDALLRAADAALYAAKERGRNRAVAYSKL